MSATLEGRYWTSSLFEGDPSKARDFDFTTYATTGSYSIGEALRRRGLSVRGVQEIGQPKLKVSETFLEFENTKVGQSSQLDWTITNVGNAQLDVSSLTVPAGFSTDFSNWSPKSLAAGESHTFKIFFTPTEAKTYSGKMVLKSNATNTPEASFTIGGIGKLETVPVSGVRLDKSSIDLAVGCTATITATVLPENADNKGVTWTSSKTLVATVSPSGVVTAFSEGSAVITVTTADGGYTASCVVTVSSSQLLYDGVDNGHFYVDLGLPSGLKWATCNVGAGAPEEYGDYFAWGEIVAKDEYTWTNYKFRTGGDSEGNIIFSKYNTSSSHGPVDNIIRLELEDDAARANWGGNWRMPTYDEFVELFMTRYNETEYRWKWVVANGHKGWEITYLSNGHSIFLPAAGNRRNTNLISAGSRGSYWTATIFPSLEVDQPDKPDYMLLTVLDSGDFLPNGVDYRYYGNSVRPVSDLGMRVSVTGISLDRSSQELYIDETATIIATCFPSNATQQDVIWQSSNSSVATVSYKGVVTGVASGTATITATTYDGGYTVTCEVTVSSYQQPYDGKDNGHYYVDLGLPSGTKWATCNIGADSPADYGDYFAWGATEPFYESKDPLVWKNGKETGYTWTNGPFITSWDSWNTFQVSKYNNRTGFGPVDNKTILELEDDAAHVNWGDSWRMPTNDEFEELVSTKSNETDYRWEWRTINKHAGWLITYLVNRNCIFLPAAGLCSGVNIHLGRNYAISGNYWSSSLDRGLPGYALGLGFGSYYFNVSSGYASDDYRFIGQSVRPVKK